MITDVFSAGVPSLSDYRRAGFPDPARYGFRTVQARDLDPVALAILDVLLSGASYEQALETASTSPADTPNLYEEPVITTLSDRTVRLLPAVGEESLVPLASDWAQFPELVGRDPEALRSWLGGVRSLCVDTATSGNLLFVWNCL